MKKLIFITLLWLPNLVAKAQNKQLKYVVTIAQFQKFYNAAQEDSLYSMFSARMQAMLPVPKTKELINGLHAQLGLLEKTEIISQSDLNATYKSTFEKDAVNIVIALNEKDQLSALFFQPIQEKEKIAESKETSNFNTLTSSGDTLFGTLKMPSSGTEKPNIVLMIAGSGPTDRDCNSKLGLHTNAFKMLADSLSQAGIASVRFDKRGVGASVAALSSEADLRFDDMVTDVTSFIKKIKATNSFNKVFIAGHSEGSLIGMMAAQKEKVDGFISIAGAGAPADIILAQQLKKQAPNATNEINAVLSSLKKGKTIEVTDATLAPIFHASVQPYLISWFAYNPQLEIKKLTIPVLIVQGNRDLQITVTDAKDLKEAQPQAQLLLIEDMNHILKPVSTDIAENQASYNNPNLALSAQLSKAIIKFCR